MPTLISAIPVLLTGFGLALFWMQGNSNRCRRRIFAMTFLCAYIYNTTYFVIDAMTGNGVDESFFYHLEQGVEGAGLGQHKNILLAATFAILIGITVTWATLRYSSRIINRKKQSMTRQMIPLIAVFASFAIHPFTFALHQQYSLSILAKTLSLGENPYGNGNNGNDDWEPSAAFQEAYRDPQEEIQQDFHPTKNILHIYMESLEHNYFDDTNFKGVTPNLRKWEREAISFTNIDQAENTGWTVAGLVASLCGIPLLTTGGSGNSMQGTNDFLPGATCLTDLLKEAGYTQTFVGGADMNFAGKGSFLRTHGFDNLLGKDELVTEQTNEKDVSGWGLKDDALLDVVFDKYKELSSTAKPFALYGLTLDTHGSHPSRRCEKDNVLEGDGTIVDSVRCTDYLLDKFLHRVLDEDSKRGNNTLIIVSSDHLAMGYANPGRLQNSGPRRNTFFVLGNGGQPQTHATLGTMMDVPATILSLLGYPRKGIGFGRDLMTGESLLSQDPSFRTKLLSEMGKDIRRQFWRMPSIRNSAKITMKSKQLRLGGKTYSIPVLFSANSKGMIEEIFLLDNTQDKIPIALREHSGTITVVIDNCKYFQSKLASNNGNYCLFINDESNYNGWIRLLGHTDYVSVDLNSVLHMTQPSASFVQATLNNTKNLCQGSVKQHQDEVWGAIAPHDRCS